MNFDRLKKNIYKLKNAIIEATSEKMVVNLITRVTPDESTEVFMTRRCDTDKQQPGQKLVPIEHKKFRENPLKTAYRAASEEYPHKYKSPEELYEPLTAFKLPSKRKGRFGRLSRHQIFYGIVFLTPYDESNPSNYIPNKYEVEEVGWVPIGEVKDRVVPTIMELVSPEYHESLWMIIGNVLSGNYDFGENAYTLKL